MAKLSEQQITDIRASTESLRTIAAKHGVSHQLISQIKRGDIYNEQEQPPEWLNRETLIAIARSGASQRIIMQRYGLSQAYVSMIQRIVRCMIESED